MQSHQEQALQDIKEKTSQLAKLKKGENRNTKGFSAMRSVGKYVIHGFISETEFTDLFRQAYQQNGQLQKIGETEFLSTVRRALDGCKGDPFPKLNRQFLKEVKTFNDQALQKKGYQRTAKYQYYDKHKTPTFQKLRYEHPDKQKTFLIRHRGHNNQWYFGKGGCKETPYHLPDILNNRDATILLCEGEKDADTAKALGFISTSINRWPDCAAYFKDRHVVIIPDNDEAGELKSKQSMQALTGIAATLRLLKLPDLPDKGDLSDWVQLGGTKEQLDALIANCPTIKIDTLEELLLVYGKPHETLNAILQILARTNRIFKRGNQLVEVASMPIPDSSMKSSVNTQKHITPIKPGRLVTLIHQHAQVKRQNKKGETFLCDLPLKFCTLLLEQTNEQWTTIEELDGITRVPVVEPNGTLITTPGYHRRSRLYIDIEQDDWHPVAHPEETLMQWFTHFPFETNMDRAIHMAALLTALIRPLLKTAPAFVYNATAAGTGKTMLARCCGLLAFGFEPTLSGYPYENAELNKRLDSMILCGKQIVVFDNINRSFGNDQICQLLTTSQVDIRKLGSNEELALPNKLLIFGTGNNIMLSADMDRRTLICHLDANMEHPQSRQFEFHPEKKVLKRRKEMIMAALQMISHAYKQGPVTKRAGSFESWGVVADAVFHITGLNVADRLMYPDDLPPEKESFIELVEHWYDAGLGLLTAKEISQAYERRFDIGGNAKLITLSEIIVGALSLKHNRRTITHTAIGKYLSSKKNMIAGPYKLVKISHGNKRASFYKVIRHHNI